LSDVAIRDRRWCQGNLQHAAILPARGLHWVSRLHLLMGIGSYVTSPLWLAFLLSGVLIALQSHFVRPEYFGDGKSLFPRWPEVDPVQAKWVFIGTMGALLAPKLLAFIVLLFDRRGLRGCGGAVRAFASILIETLLGGLIAPIAMLMQSTAVVLILAGRDSGWNAQQREDGRLPFRAVWLGYWRYTAFGFALAAAAYAVSPALFLWMTPVLLGLALAIPLVLLSASRRVGIALRRAGLLRIVEEYAPPAILARAATLRAELREPVVEEDGVTRLLRDRALRYAHTAMLPPQRRRRQGAINEKLVIGLAKLAECDTVAEAVAALTRPEKTAVLGDGDAIEALTRLGDRDSRADARRRMHQSA
jgi:membrane glycosyltransferase